MSANNGGDTSRVSVDMALVVTGVLTGFFEVLRVIELAKTGHDDPSLVGAVNTLLIPFVGIISADRLGNVLSKVRDGSGSRK